MAPSPSYPDEAQVGAPVGKPDAASAETGKPDEPNASKRKRDIATGAAIGIGSAALVAALLYANRSRRDPPRGEE